MLILRASSIGSSWESVNGWFALDAMDRVGFVTLDALDVSRRCNLFAARVVEEQWGQVLYEQYADCCC
jgi:hypothetical protein